MAGPAANTLPIRVSRVQRRTMIVLVGTQTATGLGFAAAFAVSNLLAAQLSGSQVIGGAASTTMLVGAAVSAYVLAAVAARRGRRPALALGSLLSGVGAVGAAAAVTAGSWPGLLAAMVPFGAAIATSLAARFAATDLADPRRVGRDLAVVLWALTVGVLVGPNLADASQRWAGSLGLAPAAGPYLLSAAAFGAALLGTVAGLRPDPLLVRREGAAGAGDTGVTAAAGSPWRALGPARFGWLAVGGIALSHLVMVGVMSMAAVHMGHSGASLRLIGLVISLHIASMYVLSPAFGLLADWIGSRQVLVAGVALQVLSGLTIATMGGSPAQLTAGLILLGLGWSAGLVGGSALLVETVPAPHRPAVQGFSDMTMNVAGALGGVLAGVAVAVWSYPLLGLIAAVLAASFVLTAVVTAGWSATP